MAVGCVCQFIVSKSVNNIISHISVADLPGTNFFSVKFIRELSNYRRSALCTFSAHDASACPMTHVDSSGPYINYQIVS